jgi:hypothetical protein
VSHTLSLPTVGGVLVVSGYNLGVVNMTQATATLSKTYAPDDVVVLNLTLASDLTVDASGLQSMAFTVGALSS